MADGTPQAESNISYHKVSGFLGLGVCVLRFPDQVPDRARCKLCKCIPRRIYPLLCPHHGLCLDCKKYCDGFYCDECHIHTTREQLGVLHSKLNLDGILLQVLCDVCGKQLLLGELEEHLYTHTNQGHMEASKTEETTNQHADVPEKPLRVSDAVCERCCVCNENVKNSNYEEHLKMHIEMRNNQGDSIVQETPNQDTAMEVEETESDETRPHTENKEHYLDRTHTSQCPKMARECSDCGVNVLNGSLQNPLDTECRKRLFLCGACKSLMCYDERGKHRSECPKIERKCSDCGINVLYENLQNHQELECQKRVALCDACKSAMSYDELGDHDQECLEKPVVCDDCESEVLRKDESKHAYECPMRAVCCENCDGFYPYSSEEKRVHLETCEYFVIECGFKEYGCNEKAPRKEMQEHEKDPHNALLSQKILGLQKRIENLEEPLTALVEKLRNEKLRKEKLRNPHSVGTSQ